MFVEPVGWGGSPAAKGGDRRIMSCSAQERGHSWPPSTGMETDTIFFVLHRQCRANMAVRIDCVALICETITRTSVSDQRDIELLEPELWNQQLSFHSCQVGKVTWILDHLRLNAARAASTSQTTPIRLQAMPRRQESQSAFRLPARSCPGTEPSGGATPLPRNWVSFFFRPRQRAGCYCICWPAANGLPSCRLSSQWSGVC